MHIELGKVAVYESFSEFALCQLARAAFVDGFEEGEEGGIGRAAATWGGGSWGPGGEWRAVMGLGWGTEAVVLWGGRGLGVRVDVGTRMGVGVVLGVIVRMIWREPWWGLRL